MILTAQKGKGKKIHILIDGEYVFTTDDEFWFTSGMKSGAKISDEEFSEFKERADYRFGMNKAIDLLSRRDYSSAELNRKLCEKISPEVAAQVMERVEELSLIDDEAYAIKMAEYYQQSKGMGKKGIKNQLYRRGIDSDIIERTLENLQGDEKMSAVALIRKKYYNSLTDEKGRKRVFSALVRLGYSYSDIRSAMSECAQNIDFYCED